MLSEVLAGHTATPESCWFAVWEGWGQLQGSPAVSGLARGGGATVAALVPEDVLRAGRVRLRGRSFVLLHGAVTDVVEVLDRLWGQSPNLWWPADRAWCVATEIDFGWSYVAGSVAAVAEVIARPELEALETDVDHGVQYTSDRINADLA